MDTSGMNKPVQFQRRTPAQGRPPLGEPTESWEDVFSEPVYASIRGISARERMRAGAVSMTTTHTVGTRFHPDISSLKVGYLRAVYDGRLFNITGVNNIDERDEFLVFDCEEGTKVGV